MQLGLRIDVDTRLGLQEGVPRLLDLLRRHSIHASFFVTFGPDHSGRAIKRIFRPAFIAKMWRTNPFRLYGFKTLLAGTLLPASPVGEGYPGLLKDIVAEGHELGIHGYDHVLWQDRLDGMQNSEIESQLKLAYEAYERVIGAPPNSTAAPGWICTRQSLEVQEQFNFLYASDVRGDSPFMPVSEGSTFTTLQLPTTFPTMDELLGRERDINGCLLSHFKTGLNIHTIHAEVEGRPHLSLFEDFIEEVVGRNISVVPLRDLANEVLTNRSSGGLPTHPVIRDRVAGRSGWVACQGARDGLKT